VTTEATITRGLCNDGWTPYVPGINCYECGKFVGRDGHINIECFEMSSEVAGCDGICGRCLRAHSERREPE
jgi:hypothetical protein